MKSLKIDTSPVLKRLALLTLAALFSAALFIGGPTPVDVGAVTESELRNNLDALEAELAEGEAILANIEAEVDTLENKLAQLAAQINQINTQIEKTELELEQLTIDLEKAEAEEARQKSILADNLRDLYISGNVSTLDLILGSEDFSDFVNQQEYLDRLKDSVKDSTNRVIALKEEIAANKAAQEELLAKQEAQKKDLKNNQAEQQDLLDKTKGQEAAYQDLVADLQAQREQAEAELAEFIANQQWVSLGYVNRGDFIGRMGNSGFSTGVHLHLGIYKNGSTVNPYAGGASLIDGYLWPTPSTRVTQTYGCGAPYYWYPIKCADGTSLHSGLDIGASVSGVSGDPLYAIDGGDIVFRGWWGGFGNLVIIDHGGGVQSYYGHLLE